MPCVRGTTPRSCTTSWWLFPPATREVQCDEKWAFVGKKEKPCEPDNPDDRRQGDHWDHVGFDPEHRLVLQRGAGEADRGKRATTRQRCETADGRPHPEPDHHRGMLQEGRV